MQTATGWAAQDVILFGPTAATASLFTGAVIGAAIPFARAIAKPLSKFARLAEHAIPGGLATLAGLQLRSRFLVQPYGMLLETMRLAGITGHQGGHLLPTGIFTKVPRELGLAIPMAGSVGEKLGQHWRFHRALEMAWDVTRRKLGRNPTVDEYLKKILPDALQNADVDPAAALHLAAACEKQALKFGHSLEEILPDLTRNTAQ